MQENNIIEKQQVDFNNTSQNVKPEDKKSFVDNIKNTFNQLTEKEPTLREAINAHDKKIEENKKTSLAKQTEDTPNLKSLSNREAEEIDERLSKRYLIVQKDGNTSYALHNDPYKIAFTHQADKLSTKESDPKTISDMLDKAKSESWQSIKLSGTEEFKREAWIQAQLRGIETSGYKPTETDIARLEKEMSEKNKTQKNQIQNNHKEQQQETKQTISSVVNAVEVKQEEIKKTIEQKPTETTQTTKADDYKNLSREDFVQKNPDLKDIYIARDVIQKMLDYQEKINKITPEESKNALKVFDNYAQINIQLNKAIEKPKVWENAKAAKEQQIQQPNINKEPQKQVKINTQKI